MQKKIRTFYNTLVGAVIMTITAIPLIILNILTFNYTRSRFSPYITSKSSRLILILLGVKYKLPKKNEYPTFQTVYTFNHNSFLDIIILTALDIPNTRFLLSERTLIYPTLTLAAFSIGILYVPQKKSERRRSQFFDKMVKLINGNTISIGASSEGVHDFIPGIADFNNEIYTMAENSCKNITCLFIKIPESHNPRENFYFTSTDVKVDIFYQYDMANSDDHADGEHVEHIRKKYIAKYENEHQ